MYEGLRLLCILLFLCRTCIKYNIVNNCAYQLITFDLYYYVTNTFDDEREKYEENGG